MKQKLQALYKLILTTVKQYYIYLLMVPILLLLAAFLFVLYGGKLLVDEEALQLSEITTIETVDGEIVWEIYDERRTVVPIEDIPLHVQEAFIAIEDRRFFEHAGVDMRAIIRAIYKDLIAFSKVEGASTITQQLAKNLFLENEKTWLRKTKEMMVAIYLERTYTKEEILALYLNKIYFGEGIYGIEEASKYYFSKPVKDISVGEGALLAGMAKGPNAYSPIHHYEKAVKRRDVVLEAMMQADFITNEDAQLEQNKTLQLNKNEPTYDTAVKSYVDLVIDEAEKSYDIPLAELKRGGYRIVTTLDAHIQTIAYDAFQQDKYFNGSEENPEGAFILLDQESGGVVSAIGGRSYETGDLNRVIVKRQPGSTIKPLAVYGPALMLEKYQPYTLIRDEALGYDGYEVSNADGEYSGAITIYEALVTSKNAATVWLLNEIGIKTAKDYLEALNMPVKDEGLAIALGGLSEGLSPLELAAGYRTFSQEGKYVEPFFIQEIHHQGKEMVEHTKEEPENIFSPQVAWDMTRILSDVVKRGTAKGGKYRKALAGKTGSTQHPFVKGKNKDAWFVGYTPEYVSAMWMGYDQSDETHYLLTGSEMPTKLTKYILNEINKHHPLGETFVKPPNVEDLPEPIELPTITNVQATYILGGKSLVKGKLTWDEGQDQRVVYHIYRKKDGMDERIGEVTGKSSFIIDEISLFSSEFYYVIPYDPLTKLEGKPSEAVEISW